jgi:hypothetical protein
MHEFICEHCQERASSVARNARFCRKPTCQRARKRANQRARTIEENIVKPQQNAVLLKKIEDQQALIVVMQQQIKILGQHVVKLKNRVDSHEYSYRYDLEVGNR